MEIEDWFLSTSQNLIGKDIYAARSWLLTAKNIFPQSFRLQVEEYTLEFNKKNVEECSRVLSDIFREFSNEAVAWDEIDKLIQAVEGQTDLLRKAIFESLPPLTQQRMILASAECRDNITQYSKLLLVLMNKFPQTVSQYGMSLTEKLVDSEKKDISGGPVNHYRKLLVREVLPVICRSGNINVSHKHFYKWLQKSTEFYACYFTSESEHAPENAWLELEQLRSNVARQCSWNIEEDPKSPVLADRISFMRELVRRSRTDVGGAVNRKQIFYTTLILLFEASSKYMSYLSPSIYRGNDHNNDSAIVIIDVDEESNATEQREVRISIKKAPELSETFLVAKEAWSVLHTNESFEKDFNHLLRRWKCDRWFWFQLFVCNLLVYNGDHNTALEKLKQLIADFNEEIPRHEIRLRTYCHVVSSCFSLRRLTDSCQYIFDSILLLPFGNQPATSFNDHVVNLVDYVVHPGCKFPLQNSSSPPKCHLQLIRLLTDDFLSVWVHIFILSLQEVSKSVEDDSILGHTMALSQHNWPRWRPQCKRVLNRIAEKRSFHFDLFSKYIINVDILEETAFLKNNKGTKFIVSPPQNTKPQSKKAASRENDEEFWKSIMQNVQRSGENIDLLIRNYLLECKDSITACLNMVEPI